MLTISKPLSAGQAHRYHAEEFQNARENYYSEADRIRGAWQGQLAATWGLVGEVRDQHFQRLAEGQHPITGEPLVRHQTARQMTNANGQTTTTMEHRAGWDATFSAPKSVSLTALVGKDIRVREAHRESVCVALRELEPYIQARLGGNRRPETTGNAVMALFEHDSARPVNGYAAPQLHTHVVIFNLTQTADGTVRPLQPRELFRTQQYATAVYRSELAARLSALGYEIERGRSGQPEIRGYTPEYLEASSPRRQQIEASSRTPTTTAPRRRRSRPTRRANPRRMSRMMRCSNDIGKSPSISATSRGTWSTPPSIGEPMPWNVSMTPLAPDVRPSHSRAIAIWNAKPSSRSARSCATRYSDHSAKRAWKISSRRSIAGSSAASYWPFNRSLALLDDRSRRRRCSNVSKRRSIACGPGRISMPSW